MGVEFRKVAADWQHPKDNKGIYIPLRGANYSEQLAEWEEGEIQWEKGFCSDWNGGWKLKEADEESLTFEEWQGKKPVKGDYMPEWGEAEKTHIQLYQDTTEGTPISEVFSADEIGKFCEFAAENHLYGAFWTKEEWMKMFINDTGGNKRTNMAL